MGRVLRFPKWFMRSERRTTKSRQSVAGPSPYQRRLVCEPLEDRRLLSVLTVTKATDDGSSGTLRYEISAAAAGDTIQFAPSLDGKTITLTSGLLDVTKSLQVVGPGASQLTIDANDMSEVFAVESTASATSISGLMISGGFEGPLCPGGGGIYVAGNLTVTDCVFTGNQACFGTHGGGGIYLDGEVGGVLTVSGCVFSGNSGAEWGGGISCFGNGTLTVTNCTFSGNGASWGAGIACAGGDTTITNCSVSGNSGGGISNQDGAVTITGSTISGNTAGAGIDNEYSGTVTVIDTTVSGNTGSQEGGGAYNTAALTFQDSTIAGNSSSGDGGGIYNYEGLGTVKLVNTIVAGNQSNGNTSPDIYGAVTASSYNIIGAGNGSSGLTNGSNGNQVGTTASKLNPKLGSLADNGGSTQTMALLPGSPAIDNGSNTLAANAGVTQDQRGLLRRWPANGTVDIGAYEYQPVVTSIVPATGSTSGGTTVTITGMDLTGATAVKFGTVAGTIVTNTATQITATSPAGTAGPVDVTVVTSVGASATSSADQFTYVAVPTDISLSNANVAENQPTGTTVGTLSTTDPDSGNTFTYSLVTGTGSTDNTSFTISGGTLQTAATFNYEAQSS